MSWRVSAIFLCRYLKDPDCRKLKFFVSENEGSGLYSAQTVEWRKEGSESEEFHAVLLKLRQQIDQLDDELMSILGQRMRIADMIGDYKKENSITILQTKRWNEILERAFKKGEHLGLSKEFITKYFNAVHLESIAHQTKRFNS